MFLRLIDFKIGEYHIPNASGVEYDPTSFGNTEELQSFIDKYEPKAVISILGFELYLELLPLADSTRTNRLVANADEKYDKLLNGDITVGYDGMIEALKAYVYFHFLQYKSEELTSTGVKKIESNSASLYTVRYKMVNAWSDYKNIVLGIDGSEMNVRFVYNNSVSVNYNKPPDNTIYGYILKNIELYGAFKMQTINDINRFDI